MPAMDRESIARLYPEGAPLETVRTVEELRPPARECGFCGVRCLLETVEWSWLTNPRTAA